MNHAQCHRQYFHVRRGTETACAAAGELERPRALLLVWSFAPDPPPHELALDLDTGARDRVDTWDANALALFPGDVVMHVGHLEPHADRLYGSSRRLARRLREGFELVQRVPITVGVCQAVGSAEDREALTVWRRRGPAPRGEVPPAPMEVS